MYVVYPYNLHIINELEELVIMIQAEEYALPESNGVLSLKLNRKLKNQKIATIIIPEIFNQRINSCKGATAARATAGLRRVRRLDAWDTWNI